MRPACDLHHLIVFAGSFINIKEKTVMKKYTITALSIFLVLTLSSCFSSTSIEDEKYRKGWTLAWEDDFDELLNEAEWSKTQRGKQHRYRYMSSDDALYVLQDGKLVLRGLANQSDDDDLPFITGGITREGVKANEVKRIEVRVKINPTVGATPYISLIPTSGEDNISIDLMQQYGVDEFIYQSVSSEYTTTQGMPDNPPSSALVQVDPMEYHIYSVEKYADSLVFYIDGMRAKKYPRIPTDIPGQFPYNDLDFDLFLGLRINKDTDPTILPADMFIDWVRYYEPETVEAE